MSTFSVNQVNMNKQTEQSHGTIPNTQNEDVIGVSYKNNYQSGFFLIVNICLKFPFCFY